MWTGRVREQEKQVQQQHIGQKHGGERLSVVVLHDGIQCTSSWDCRSDVVWARSTCMMLKMEDAMYTHVLEDIILVVKEVVGHFYKEF